MLLIEPATPFADEQRAWLEWARGLASSGRRLVAIVLTHHHTDHVGGAELFARELALPLWGHALTRSRLPALSFERELVDGETLALDGPMGQRWRVLHTPGHAPGHVCLFEETSGHVVVGDMVATQGTILVEPKDGDMRVYIEQLERLAALGARVALPAHGDPIDEPSKLFDYYVAHRRMREGKILDVVRAAGAQGVTTPEIVPNAYSDTPMAAWPLALLSTAAHLVKLVADGLVTTDGERHYPKQ